MTAMASLSHLVQKPLITVSPKAGFDVSFTSGSRLTTLSPTLLKIDWRCEIAQSKQNEARKSTKGWALFGVFACVYKSMDTYRDPEIKCEEKLQFNDSEGSKNCV
ncbi:hypothetical protein L6452_02668 [Arctium lappa]|uniref:Uncharacterized protein n=1 Tax=Arctium lappa TaxID=4217 RepID=A0ACB9FJH0_ARCLA|nr:hypothetical protein L6452_02668 [Arctium lappa]